MDHRPLYEIARDIRADYASKGKPVYYAAKPYVDAMAQLTSINENYFADSAESVILYALSNLSTWRGEKAREVKAELKAILK
jgi:hypothetical protein